MERHLTAPFATQLSLKTSSESPDQTIIFSSRESDFITIRLCIIERDNAGGPIGTRNCLQYTTISYGWVSTRPLQLGLETKRQRKHAKCSTITLVTPPWQPIAIFRMCYFGTKKMFVNRRRSLHAQPHHYRDDLSYREPIFTTLTVYKSNPRDHELCRQSKS